ncbi:hypothetical protein AGMMS49938_16450 [Fibrobacterales bacterium]|nr:hypothetical protein AGMMS49938_16450 [Fibrobacterales bacterium]
MKKRNCSQNNALDESFASTGVNEVPNFVIRNDKIELPKVRYIISYACNLKCEYCFYPFHEKKICERAELADSFEKWSRKLNPSIVTLYGGEPLLNPDIVGIVSDARSYWKDSIIEIITNGILLSNISKDVLRVFSENNVYVTISRHLRTQNHLDKIAESFSQLKQFGITHSVYKADLLWRALYAIDDDGVPIPHNEKKPEESFANCDGINTTSIRGNCLYKCANVATCTEMVKKGLLSNEWNELLTHKPISFENTTAEILEYLNQGVMSACSLCTVKYPEIHEPKQFSGKRLQQMKYAIQQRIHNDKSKLSFAQTPPPLVTRRAGERITLSLNSTEYATFRWCPAGTFMMGSPDNEIGRNTNESQYQVTFSRGFWILETQVTQTMWECVMKYNPSCFKGAKFPVEQVSFDACQNYIQKLNDLSVGIPGLRFSLPTEAEWEYACRAGTTTAYHFGNILNLHQANFEKQQTKTVGAYLANAWGLYDMHGNVWEWCSNWNCDYPNSPVTDPIGKSTGTHRIVRGGGWNSLAIDCRTAERLPIHPSLNFSFLGLRLSLIFEEL